MGRGAGGRRRRLTPPPQATAVLAPEVRIRHMAHQPDEDPERLAEKPQAEREPLQGMGPQISLAGPLPIQPPVGVKPREAPQVFRPPAKDAADPRISPPPPTPIQHSP